MGITAKELAARLNLSATAVSMALNRNKSPRYPGSRKSRLRFQPTFHEKKCDRRHLLYHLPRSQRHLKLYPNLLRAHRRNRTGMPQKRLSPENLPALRKSRRTSEIHRRTPHLPMCRRHPSGNRSLRFRMP